MMRIFRVFYTTLLLISLFPLVAAEGLDSRQPISRENGRVALSKGPSLLRFAFRTPEGIQQVILKSRRAFTGGKSLLFQGTVLKRKDQYAEQRASAQIVDNTISVRFQGRTLRAKSPRLYFAEFRVDQKPGLVSHPHRFSFSRLRSPDNCAEFQQLTSSTQDVLPSEASPPAMLPATITKQVRILRVAVDADSEFMADVGDNAQAYTEGVLNAVESMYLKQLGIGLDLTTFHSFNDPRTQPYQSNSPVELLTQFSNYTNETNQLGDADVFHLFTGKDFVIVNNENTIVPLQVAGLAFKGTACRLDGQASFGFSRRIEDSIFPLTVAHEIAHNLNASHDISGSSIMSPSINSASSLFSNTSIAEIEDYLSNFGQCLGTGEREIEESTPEQISFELSAIVNKTGVITLNTAMVQPSNLTCSFDLYSARNFKLLMNSEQMGGKHLVHATLNDGSGVLTTRFEKKGSKSTYLRAQVSCTDGTIRLSDIVKIGKRQNGQIRLPRKVWFQN